MPNELIKTLTVDGTTYDLPTKTSELSNDSGFITSESDPVFSASAAHGISSSDISTWNAKSDFSGSYNDLTDKPTIPAAVTESTVAGWGFTKNTGTYSKPSGGIPKTDLASAVQTSLEKADTALQSYTETDPVFTASVAHGITATDITNWDNKSDFSGDYDDLSNKPTIPTVPTTVSAFTNDAGYLTSYTETDPVFSASAAHSITSADIANWNGKYAWFDGSSYTSVVALCNAMVAKPKSIYLKQTWAAQALSDCPTASVTGNAKLTVVNGSNTSASAPNYMTLMYEVTNGTIHEMWRGATYGSSADTRSVKWFKLSTSYGSGDVVNVGACVFAGYLDGSKNLYFHIPLNKDMSAITSASISTDTSWAIYCSGSVLLSNATLASFGTITCTKTDTGVLVKVAPSSTGSLTARETVSVRANVASLTLT